MKKTLLLVVAVFVMNSAFSQVSFGVKAGANMSALSDVEISALGMSIKIFEQDGMSFGYNGGVFANISLGKTIGFQPELLFSMQGGKQKPGSLFSEELEDIDIFGNVNVSFQLGYVQVPLLMEIKPAAGLGILVGPQVGYNIIRKAIATYDGVSETVSGVDFDDMFGGEFGEDGNWFKKLDAGLVVGLQYTIQKLTIGARYNLGFTNGFDMSITEDGMKMSAKGWKSNVFQIGLGFSF